MNVLHPDFPVVEGRQRLTPRWSIELDQPHNRRIEEGSLVLWRPRFTIWINAWNNDQNALVEELLGDIKSETSPDAFEIVSDFIGPTYRHAYRLEEDGVQGYYGYVIGADGYLQIAVYFDRLEELPLAKAIIDSVRYSETA